MPRIQRPVTIESLRMVYLSHFLELFWPHKASRIELVASAGRGAVGGFCLAP
jgi:hypothetical protein